MWAGGLARHLAAELLLEADLCAAKRAHLWAGRAIVRWDARGFVAKRAGSRAHHWGGQTAGPWGWLAGSHVGSVDGCEVNCVC